MAMLALAPPPGFVLAGAGVGDVAVGDEGGAGEEK